MAANRKFFVNLDLNGNEIQKVVLHNLAADPTGAGGQVYYRTTDEVLRYRDSTKWNTIATQSYVDQSIQGLDTKESVKVATTANVDLGAFPLTLDGYTLQVGDRILVKDQTAAEENGIYVVEALGASASVARAADADVDGDITGATFTFVEGGTLNSDSGWVVSSDGIPSIDIDPITWVRFSGAGQIEAGAGLTKEGNRFDVNGTADRILVNNDTVDIASTYVGQASITTLGTITTGVWNGSTINVAQGGLGNTTFTTNRVAYYDGTSFVSSNLDPSKVTSKYSATIGDAVSTTFVLTHNLVSTDVIVQVFEIETGDEIIADIQRTDANNVTIEFEGAPATNEFRVVIIG